MLTMVAELMIVDHRDGSKGDDERKGWIVVDHGGGPMGGQSTAIYMSSSSFSLGHIRPSSGGDQFGKRKLLTKI